MTLKDKIEREILKRQYLTLSEEDVREFAQAILEIIASEYDV